MALPLSYNVSNMIVRWKVTLLAIGGIALVVAVMLVLTAMSNGFRAALRSTGSPDNAIVVQRGANARADLGLQPRQREHDHRGRPRRARRAAASRWPRPKS